MRFKCVSASVKTAFAFSFVWRYNVCVSHACVHWLRRLLRFPWYMYMYMCFTRVFASIKTAFAFFFGIASQCMRFKYVFASVKTTFAFSFVWR